MSDRSETAKNTSMVGTLSLITKTLGDDPHISGLFTSEKGERRWRANTKLEKSFAKIDLDKPVQVNFCESKNKIMLIRKIEQAA